MEIEKKASEKERDAQDEPAYHRKQSLPTDEALVFLSSPHAAHLGRQPTATHSHAAFGHHALTVRQGADHGPQRSRYGGRVTRSWEQSGVALLLLVAVAELLAAVFVIALAVQAARGGSASGALQRR